MIRVVAAVGGEVKGDAEALLTRLEGVAVKGVAFFDGAEAGVLADRVRQPGEASRGGRRRRTCRMVQGRCVYMVA